ncbi:MAG TPA: expansin EXLX1 family cellulose-binding protein [Nannocystaceae bacterium]|nr:expansin EXLX1 family cellulose-binding protein [Nannocystaceae bacterium]
MRLVRALACVLAISCGGDDDDASSSGDAASNGGEVGTPCAGAAQHSGEATYYDFADGSGNCGFPATPNDLMVGAMNHVDYAASAVCGACVRIDGPNGSVDVRIVDQCPDCPEGHIDLSPEAFEHIAAIEAGRVPISWEYTSCDVDGPVVYHFKDGSNAYWTAVQIRNHRAAIARFEVQQAGAWIEVARVDYNYFVKDDGMGEGPFDFRITDVDGNVLEDHGIPLLNDADAPGGAQFPSCG